MLSGWLYFHKVQRQEPPLCDRQQVGMSPGLVVRGGLAVQGHEHLLWGDTILNHDFRSSSVPYLDAFIETCCTIT